MNKSELDPLGSTDVHAADLSTDDVRSLTVSELAMLWSCDEQAVYRGIKAGTILAFRLPTYTENERGGIRIPLTEARRVMQVRTTATKDTTPRTSRAR